MLKLSCFLFQTKRRKDAQQIRSLIYQHWGKPFGKNHGISPISRQNDDTFTFSLTTSTSLYDITMLKDSKGAQPVVKIVQTGQCRISSREKDAHGNIRLLHLDDITIANFQQRARLQEETSQQEQRSMTNKSPEHLKLLDPEKPPKDSNQSNDHEKTSPQGSVSANDFTNRVLKIQIQINKKVGCEAIKEHLADNMLFRTVHQALPHVKTHDDERTVIDLLQNLRRLVLTCDEERRLSLISTIASADPSLLFDFYRHPALKRHEARVFAKKLRKELNKLVPKRAAIVTMICDFAVRRLIGDQSACTPLLYGPPGGGKSELVTRFAKAMSATGVNTKAIFQPMTQDGMLKSDNVGALRLLGSSLHYSNGAPGDLYDTIRDPEVKFCITLIDEAEKTSFKEYLIGLLDPKTPLEDNFVREICKGMDMRNKSMFLLTANDPDRLNSGPQDPLWSRLKPAYLPAYTEADMIDLAITLVTGPDNPYQPSRREARKAVRASIAELGADTSFRAILDHVNGRLFRSIVLEEDLGSPGTCLQPAKPAQRRIGFQI